MKKGGEESFSDVNTKINQEESMVNFRKLATLPSFILDWIENNLNELIIIADKKGEIFFISKPIERFLGYMSSEILGTTWDKLVAPDNALAVLEQLEKRKNNEFKFNVGIRNKYGQYITFNCFTAKIVDKTNDDFYYISILKKHSTEKKELEELIVRSEKLVIANQLAAGIAHEIRNPLTSLKGFLQLLKVEGKKNEAYFRVMLDEIEKIESITSELLYISKPVSNNKETESINSMINDVIILLQSQANLRNIVLKLIQTEEYFFYCDRSKFKQVLINLIKNAIEAMNAPGAIKIVVKEIHGLINIDVIDEGPGIPANILHKLGEPFFTTKESGTGLGLMATKQILDQHNAEITFFSNENIGSTFRIILPTNNNVDG